MSFIGWVEELHVGCIIAFRHRGLLVRCRKFGEFLPIECDAKPRCFRNIQPTATEGGARRKPSSAFILPYVSPRPTVPSSHMTINDGAQRMRLMHAFTVQ